jgi:hypothetical protein
MAALRFSVLAIFLLCACAHSPPQKSVEVESLVSGCFTFSKVILDTTKEPVLAIASINQETAHADCPCKSAVMKYSAFQKKDGNNFNLLSGQFSILGQETFVLPIADQKQLIFQIYPFIYLCLALVIKLLMFTLIVLS